MLMGLEYYPRKRGPFTMAPPARGLHVRRPTTSAPIEYHVSRHWNVSAAAAFHDGSVCNLRPTSRGMYASAALCVRRT